MTPSSPSNCPLKEVKKLSFVLPVFNEENNLPLLFEQIMAVMQNLPYEWELIFVDDGSTDNSLECIKKLGNACSNIHFISFLNNCGQSAAFTAGFDYASGEIIITMDSDLQNDPADIPKMIEEYLKGYDMVIGWRAKRQDTFAKRLASRLANKIRNAISQETVKDTGCSLKLMRSEMAKKLPMFTGMHRFLPTLMKMQGAKVAEVKVNHRHRHSGTSKYSTWGRAKTAFFDLLAVRWMKKRHFNYKVKESSFDN
ncbi:glycosyltransferase family 2 protein [Desulfovibrio litoralis]|uniref:Glycosyltransferase involved in cell wall bisynthesis n=1 Tax=Desulfovibrio litoralis DSM 11393 TaxID=1121455 RepID=A0A1M7SZC3_9BACT|nr:glycosyltransferase family 2 protein [Desulfovibrio litoralis]SHN63767.1 Glycosyltransferase involved in cell wall bisynthesis [Desulfovibrio litoralis DSM 11393]